MRHVAAALLILLPGLAAAQSVPEVRAHLEREARRAQCDLARFAPGSTGTVAGESRPVTVVAYTVEGCGGGNNWTATFGAFVRDGQRIAALPLARDLRGLPAVIEGVRIENGLIVVRGLDYGPNDGRCCPSVQRRATLAIRDGLVVNAR